ncbi:DNA topoisomerase IB [Novilysobacter spongiicola]|uniref:DNA topoisomerase n=1 Tax=Lysobacter spongiicola DSM 21749 TaxID=1122188 RepID=A0A1T4Q3J9_9GAMM|nr:DNA topoisomerase IB [Lysobacter spongiicola]SJZ98343.1 DNA topoisomerase IB [Lysobacter spongiicola DSM 21749]
MPSRPLQTADPEATARQAGLRYVCDDNPGIERRRGKDAFSYFLPSGAAVDDEATLQRIRSLAIPPAWTEVWICRTRNGHLQATGRDARGRKQYRYHPDWAQVRGDGKFDRIVAFGEALPRLRRRLRRDLKQPGFPREKVLAIVVALLADTLARIGNDSYARSNKSFGLTTLRNRHVAFVRGGRARLRFRGKGGTEHDIELDDARLARLIRRCQQLPGQALFQYKDEDGTLQPVDSGEVNQYLRDAMGEAFSAKDFRTWGGTLSAFRRLACTPLPQPHSGGEPSERALAATCNVVVKDVARELGNTPAVARKAYIDPHVFEGWRDGRLLRAAASARGPRQWEQAALKFLKAAHRRNGKGRRRAPAKR